MTNTPPTSSAKSAPVPSAAAYNAPEIEAKWTKYWFENKLFDFTVQKGHPSYSASLPPPNITGNLHLGHALNGTLQDVLFRYKRMQGFNVLWQPGTDHAGISTQIVVERELKKQGISRHDLGREAFIEKVWQWRNQYGNAILNQYKRLGVSFAWNRIVFTLDAPYVKAINKVFVQLFNEGLIYRGRRVVNWCPRCLTSLSDLEVQHEEKSGNLYFINYPLADGSSSLHIATTRPETMFADVAVAVNPTDPRYQKFIGKKVLLPLTNRQIPVIADSYVDKEFGTGILKITPAHDLNDFEVGQRHKLEMPIVIDKTGKLVKTNLVPGQYQGMERFLARQKIAEDLEQAGFLVETKKHDNAIGLCDRCSTVIEPRLSDQWYMSMQELVKPAIAAVENKQIVFVPERYGATYLDWMRNIRDWCISRQLWWGQRIPIWTCTSCGTIGAFEEAPKACLKCSHTLLEQDPDVLDTWFSSGLWPFATLGWPEKTFEMETFYPNNILSTDRQIINLWVSRMAFFSLKFTGQVPFKEVLIHPEVQTSDGKRMSKSKGNGVDPIDMINKYGTDANRFWFTSLGLKGDQGVRFREDKLEEYKRFVNKLWNAGKFVIGKVTAWIDKTGIKSNGQMNAELMQRIDKQNLSLADRWILSKYNKLLNILNHSYTSYDFHIITTELYQFTWDYFCDWYLEISKIEEVSVNTEAAKQRQTEKILYYVFEGLLRALHPIMPFITEELANQLHQLAGKSEEKSVMFAEYPTADKAFLDNEAEQEMDYLMRLIRSIRTIRQTYNVPHSAQIDVIFHGNGSEERLIKQYTQYIATLTPVKLIAKSSTNTIPARCASDTIGETTIYIPLANVIDIQKTKDKLLQRKQSVEKELQKTKQILDSNEFKTKAPLEKVQAVQKQAESVQLQIKHLEAQLKVLN